MFYQEKMGKSNMLARIPENLPRYYHIIYEIVQCFRENLFTAGVIPFTNLNVFSPSFFFCARNCSSNSQNWEKNISNSISYQKW